MCLSVGLAVEFEAEYNNLKGLFDFVEQAYIEMFSLNSEITRRTSSFDIKWITSKSRFIYAFLRNEIV